MSGDGPAEVIRGTGAIPRRSRRGYVPSLRKQTTVQPAALSFPRQCLIDRLPYNITGIGRNRADSESSFGGGLSAHVTRQYPKGQSVNAHLRRVWLCRLLEANQKVPPNPLTPAGVPVAKNTETP